MINELMEKQEELRGKLEDLLNEQDKTFAMGLLQTVDQDRLIAVALSMVEMLAEDDEPREEHLLWAMEFIDNLDTLNYEVRSKKAPKKAKKHGRSQKR